MALMPLCLDISSVSQRRQNNTPTISMHWFYNGLPPIIILGDAIGVDLVGVD